MSNLRRNASTTAKLSGGVIAAGALMLVLVIIVASMWIFGFGLFQRSTAGFRGETEQIERTQADADFRIGSYEWFFDQCAAIQAQEGRINAQLDELDGNPAPSEDRVGQINTNLAAMRGQREALIAEYNGEARKEDTSGPFRASDLPASIDATNDRVTCTWQDES